MVKLLEDLDEAPHHEREVLIDFLEPAGEIVAYGHAIEVVARPTLLSQPQTPSGLRPSSITVC